MAPNPTCAASASAVIATTASASHGPLAGRTNGPCRNRATRTAPKMAQPASSSASAAGSGGSARTETSGAIVKNSVAARNGTRSRCRPPPGPPTVSSGPRASSSASRPVGAMGGQARPDRSSAMYRQAASAPRATPHAARTRTSTGSGSRPATTDRPMLAKWEDGSTRPIVAIPGGKASSGANSPPRMARVK